MGRQDFKQRQRNPERLPQSGKGKQMRGFITSGEASD